RNPFDRIVSSYMHTWERGFTELTLGECLIKERFLIDITRYYTQIIPFIQKFSRANVLVIDFDDLIHRRPQFMQKVADFLDFDLNDLPDFTQVHANPSVGGGKKHKRWDDPTLFHKALHRFAPGLWRAITANKSRAFLEKPVLSQQHKEMIIHMLALEIDHLEKIMNKNLQHWKLII
ncbi:MAG: sulfotransferase, partial [Saprospiraceae bacterium]|nr:sulfotransferase [Saprospiraceae bacterium]